MINQQMFSSCICGNKINKGIICSLCADRLPIEALQKIYKLSLDIEYAEKYGAATVVENKKKEIELIYKTNLITKKPDIPTVQPPPKKLSPEKMAEIGKKGGRRRAEVLTPERRSEIARMGVKAKYEKFLKNKLVDNAKSEE